MPGQSPPSAAVDADSRNLLQVGAWLHAQDDAVLENQRPVLCPLKLGTSFVKEEPEGSDTRDRQYRRLARNPEKMQATFIPITRLPDPDPRPMHRAMAQPPHQHLQFQEE